VAGTACSSTDDALQVPCADLHFLPFLLCTEQNLVKVKECVKVVSMFVSTVKRVADELTQAFEDAKKKLAAPAA
jgi:hypothetical protein